MNYRCFRVRQLRVAILVTITHYTITLHVYQWWANPKSNPQKQILNLCTSNPKSEKANPKSQIADTQIKSNLQTLNPKSFPNLPKTYLLPQKIRRTTMQLIEKVVIFDGNLVFM